jgi:hypothetical protein
MIIGTVAMALIPALFGYIQNRDEIKARYSQTQHEATLGFDALAKLVKELQAATIVQHDYIVKIQAQLEMMEKFVLARTRRDVGSGYGSGSGRLGSAAPVVVEEPPSFPAPPPTPAYGKVPDDFSAAQMKR